MDFIWGCEAAMKSLHTSQRDLLQFQIPSVPTSHKAAEGDQPGEDTASQCSLPGGRARRLLRGFCQSTSAHGLGHVGRPGNLGERLLWLVVFCGALAGITWQLSSVLLTFFAYPQQEVSHMSQDPPPFPDVTVCNIEPIVAYRAFPMANDPSTQIYEYSTKKLPEILPLLERYPNLTFLSEGRVLTTKGYYENMPASEAQAAGHALPQLVVSCTYVGLDCLAEQYFSHLSDGTYYNCYTFSPANLSSVGRGVGPDMGLSLILYLDSTNGSAYPGNFDRRSNVKQSAGVRVTVHNQGTLPSPLTQGFDIMPGHSTAVALSTTRSERLGLPYDNCSEFVYHPYLPAFKYAASSCMLLKAQNHIFNRCGCLKVDLPIPDMLKSQSYCGFYNYTADTYLAHLECEVEAYFEFYSLVGDTDCCDWCHAPCLTYTYDQVISESLWPNKRYHDSFFTSVIESRPDRDSLTAYTNIVGLRSGGTFSNTTAITDNFARLNVYFRSSEVLVRQQVPSYESSNLLSDMGGTIGLWAGLSVITVCEVIRLVISLLVLPFTKK